MTKKVIALLLAMTLLLSLAACGGKNNSANSGQSDAQTENIAPAEKDEQAPSVEQEPEKAPVSEEGETQKGEQQPEEVPEEQPEEELPTEDLVMTASHSDVTLKAAGSSFRLTLSVLPQNVKVSYASEDEAIATVAEDGSVTAVAPGVTKVVLTATLPDGNVANFPCIVRCSWKEDTDTNNGPDTGSNDGTSVDLSAYFNSFLATLGAENTPAMVEMNGELMDAYYAGLSAISCKQSVLQMAAMMQVAFEFALVECESAADAETVRGIFQTRVDTQVNGGAWYPAVTEAWENASVIVQGNYVALIVAGEKQADAVQAFNAMF